MNVRCPECVRLWEIYFAISVEEFSAQEQLSAAKQENGGLERIARLGVTMAALERDLASASERVAEHRATHRSATS